MAREVRRLSAEEFEMAVRGTRISENNVRLARSVMVDGKPVSAVAESARVTHQAMSRLVGRVWTSYRTQHGLPADWRRVTVIVPEPIAEQIEGMAERAANELQQGRRVFSHERKSG